MASALADVVIDARHEDAGDAVRRATAGEGADKVIVSVADVAAAQTAFGVVRKGGRNQPVRRYACGFHPPA